MDEVIFNKDDVVKIDNKKIQNLKQKAVINPFKKIRLCLHKDNRELLQEMIIVICKGVYSRPHKHIGKTESLHIIEGSSLLIIFDENGKVIEKIPMGKEQEGGNLLCRLEENVWHTVIPISDFIVFHEALTGPYLGKGESAFASWAPKEDNDAGIKKFTDQILNSR